MRQALMRCGTAIPLLVCAAWGTLSAQGLPTPILVRADPQVVYPGSPGWLDANGRVEVRIFGENLSPDDDLGHPAGPDGGYQHVFIRGVSPHGDRATDWVPATAANGCQMYGGAARSVIILGVDPARFLSEPGSHLQVKLWVSQSATGAADPVGSGSLSSSWSAIKTVDVAPAGAVKPTPAVASDAAPLISRIVPADFTLGKPGQDYRLRIYGTFATGPCQVIFGGDASAPVPGEDAAVGYEMTPSWTSTGKDNVFHVTLPAKYRRDRPGQVTVAVVDRAGRTTPAKLLTFSAMAVRDLGRPVAVGAVAPVLRAPTSAVVPAVPPGTQPSAGVAPGGLPPRPPSPAVTPVLRVTPLPRLPQAPAEAAPRCQRIRARIPGPVVPRFELAKAEVLRAQQNPAVDLGGAARAAVRSQFPAAGAMDLEALVAVVLSECSQAAEQDLRDALASLDQVHRAKQAQRERAEKLRAQEQRLQAGLRTAVGTPAMPPVLRAATRPTLRTPVLNLELPRLAPELVHPPEPRPELTAAQLAEELRRAKAAEEELASLDESFQKRIQMILDRRAKTFETLSELLKKLSATHESLIGNLK